MAGKIGVAMLLWLVCSAGALPGRLTAQDSFEPWQVDSLTWNGVWDIEKGAPGRNVWADSLYNGYNLWVSNAQFDGNILIADLMYFTHYCSTHKAQLIYNPQTGELTFTAEDNGCTMYFRNLRFETIPDDTSRAVISFLDDFQNTYEARCYKGTVLVDDWNWIIPVQTPGPLIADTSGQQLIFNAISPDGLEQIQLRVIAKKYDLVRGGKYVLGERADTSIVSLYDNPGGSLDSLYLATLIPGHVNGREISYQIGFIKPSVYVPVYSPVYVRRFSFPAFSYRIYPNPGKASASLSGPSVGDILRLVYLVLDRVPNPRPEDWLGLDLDRNGEFDSPDLDWLLGLWRTGAGGVAEY
ncbi:MAG: hypothetical protein V1794_03340 [Candidatus Glassbacteria bacterium]